MEDFLEGFEDDEMVSIAMNNSYDVIINGMDAEGIIVESNGLSFFAHDFTDELKKEDIENMINYFVHIEDYRKCAKLDKVLKSFDNE